jgi:hypothetical protein
MITRTDILVIEGAAKEMAKGGTRGNNGQAGGTSMMLNAHEVAELCRLALEHPMIKMQAMPARNGGAR